MIRQLLGNLSPPEHIIRLLLLGVLFVGLFGTGAELLLLQHTETFWELIPLVLISLGLMILTWHAIARDPTSLAWVCGVMGLFLMTGVAGIALHYQSSIEFRLETNPSFEWMGTVLGDHFCENTAGFGTE